MLVMTEIAINRVTGVVRFQPIQLALDQPGRRDCRRNTDTEPNQNKLQCFAQNHTGDLSARGSQRHANPDLSRPSIHRVGHKTVQADTCQQQSQHAKQTRKRGDQALLNSDWSNCSLRVLTSETGKRVSVALTACSMARLHCEDRFRCEPQTSPGPPVLGTRADKSSAPPVSGDRDF